MAIQVYSQATLAKRLPSVEWPEGVRLNEQITTRKQGQHTVAEFIGARDFAAEFYERQQYEVDAGREEVPLLYEPIYNTIRDANLPKTINVNVLGPGGVIFEQVYEGGEVKFGTVGESTKTVSLVHYAAGIEYSEELFLFNQTWQLGVIERAHGKAFNALMNHVHLYPIISYSYAAANQTAADSTGSTSEEKYLRTIENGITNSRTDTSNPRPGPYTLLVSTSDLWMIERALAQRHQDGANPSQSSAIGMIRNIIAYDGWTGTRGKKSVTYAGVSAGTAYLISAANQDMDFQSYEKVPFRAQNGDGDLSRFIVEQVIYDWWGGVYSNPIAAVEELTWPS